jgi:hypothetical protein
LTPTLRARICELRSIGWSYAKISEKHKILESTVGSTCRKEASRIDNASRKRQGRPRVITEEMRDKFYNTAVHLRPNVTYREMRDMIAPGVNIRCVQELFQRIHLRKWKKLECPELTEAIAAQCLAWAEAYEDFTDVDWRRVRWSDECSIERGKGVAKE